MINYEGISYNLETIIEFRSLKLLLEALAKKQMEHNILFYGQNVNINKINNNDNINQENNIDKTETNINNENNKENDIENNFEKIWMEKINNSGLIKVFIESQKKLEEQNNFINELKNKIDSLEKNNETLIKEINETKQIIIQNKEKEDHKEKEKEKEIIKDTNEINKEEEKKEIEKVENDKDTKEKKEIIQKPENKDIKKEEEKQNENININEEIKKPKIKEDIIINEPTNTESKIINIYDTKNKTKIHETYKYEKLENQLSQLEEKINSINERLEEIEENTDNNTSDININKNDISKLKDKFKNFEKKYNSKTQLPTPAPETTVPQEEKNIEEPNDNDDRINTLENDLNNLEDKLIKMIDQKLNEFKKRKSNEDLIKDLNSQKEKLKDFTDRINIEIKTLRNKDEELENKIQELMTFSELKKINDKIKAIEQELEGSATKEDTKHILEELDKFNQELNKYKSIISNQKEMNIKTREDMLRLKEEFDEIKQDFSSLNNLLENNSLNKLIENINNITDKFVEKSLYENDMKLINKKISKLQMDVNEHNRNFAELMPKLEGILDINEFNKLKKNVEDLMSKSGSLVSSNKSLDTQEIIKNIKSMEAQVKIFMKKLENESEKEKERINDNCILASRPVGGFKCASCETYIGDIKENNIYLPWNKYHGQDRPYRLGSSFSRILQGLNIEQNYNPFLHKKNYLKSENDKRYQIQNDSLSVKKIRKIPPLNQLTISETNLEHKFNNSKSINKTIDEQKSNEYNGSGFVTNNKLKKKLNVNLWGIKSLKNLGNDKNVMTINVPSKSTNKRNFEANSFDKDNINNKNLLQEKVVKITKKPKGNQINNSEDNENNLIVPSL